MDTWAGLVDDMKILTGKSHLSFLYGFCACFPNDKVYVYQTDVQADNLGQLWTRGKDFPFQLETMDSWTEINPDDYDLFLDVMETWRYDKNRFRKDNYLKAVENWKIPRIIKILWTEPHELIRLGGEWMLNYYRKKARESVPIVVEGWVKQRAWLPIKTKIIRNCAPQWETNWMGNEDLLLGICNNQAGRRPKRPREGVLRRFRNMGRANAEDEGWRVKNLMEKIKSRMMRPRVRDTIRRICWRPKDSFGFYIWDKLEKELKEKVYLHDPDAHHYSIEELVDLYRHAKVFADFSENRPETLVYIQARVIGMPALTKDINIDMAIETNKNNGFKSNNAKELLKEIFLLFKDDEYRNFKAKNSWELGQKLFSVKEVGKKWHELVESIM